MPFQPPPESARQLKGVPFELAIPFAPDAKKRYDAFDATVPAPSDPNRCLALLKFPNDSAVFWTSKMAIDADGPAAGPGRLPGSKLDVGPDPANPNGQDATSLKFVKGQDQGLPSETVPYIVLPKLVPDPDDPRTFDPLVALGDVAVVIFRDKIVAAICGDLGPYQKIGEASIRVHEVLQSTNKINPCLDPCDQRDNNGYCRRARNRSVEHDVLFFVFPNSQFAAGELNYANIEAKVNAKAFTLYNRMRGG